MNNTTDIFQEKIYPFPENMKYVDKKCQVCEISCLANTVPCDHVWSCTLYNILTLLGSCIEMIVLSYHLFVFYKIEGKKWTTKKGIFWFANLVCVLHILRFALLIERFPFWGIAALYIDELLLMWPYPALFAMYSLLLYFWGNLVYGTGKNATWLGRNSLVVLIVFNIASFSIFSLDGLMTIFDFDNVWIVDTFLGVICLSMGIGFLVQGTKVHRLIKYIQLPTSRGEQQHQKLQRKFTVITIQASVTLLIVFIIVSGGALLRMTVLAKSLLGCQINFILVKLSEFVLIAIVCIPLSDTFKRKKNRVERVVLTHTQTGENKTGQQTGQQTGQNYTNVSFTGQTGFDERTDMVTNVGTHYPIVVNEPVFVKSNKSPKGNS